jgi:hypothetical protein
MRNSIESMTARRLRDVDLSEAGSSLVVSNEPLYLLRKLRANPATAVIAKDAPAELILRSLQEALPRKPRSLRSAVWPYVALVALSMKPSVDPLVRASKFSAPHHQWYAFIGSTLIENFRSTSAQSFQVPSTSMRVENAGGPTTPPLLPTDS